MISLEGLNDFHGFDFANAKSGENMLEKEELTGKIINACMEVRNEFGNG